MLCSIIRMQILVNMIKYYRHPFKLYFCSNPFKSPYSCFDIRPDLANTFSLFNWFQTVYFPLGWCCRIHRLHLCWEVWSHPNKYPGYDNKKSEDEIAVILELHGMRSTSSLPSLPGPLRRWLFAIDFFPVYGSNRTKLNTYAKVNYLK